MFFLFVFPSSSFGFFKSTFLPSGTAKFFWLILYISHPGSRVSNFSKELKFPLLQKGIKTKIGILMYLFLLECIAFRPSQLKELGNTCVLLTHFYTSL